MRPQQMIFLAGHGAQPAAGASRMRRYPDRQEAGRVRTHELAILMLHKDSTDQIGDQEELDTLLERQLVALEQLAGAAARPRIVPDEDPLVRSFGRVH
jgi:uncharacterized membrane protein YccC